MTHILVIWVIVAMSGNSGYYIKHDWQSIGEFNSQSACVEAARQLGYPAESKEYRCLATGKSSQKQ